MKWATALFGDPALTILAIFVGSDATQVKICGSAHPIYISLGNFLDSFRLTGEAWQTSGLVPRLDHSLMQEKGYHNKVFGERVASRQARSRREQQLFQACAWTVLKSLVDVVHEGGRYIAARRGLGPKRCLWCQHGTPTGKCTTSSLEPTRTHASTAKFPRTSRTL